MDYAAFHKKEELHQIAKKIRSNLALSAAVFSGIQSYCAHVERMKRNVAGCIHRYNSVANPFNSALQGKYHRCSKSNAVIRIH